MLNPSDQQDRVRAPFLHALFATREGVLDALDALLVEELDRTEGDIVVRVTVLRVEAETAFELLLDTEEAFELLLLLPELTARWCRETCGGPPEPNR